MKQPNTDTKQDALQILHAGVANLMSSGGWRQALEFRARFHTYSFFNTSLILAQQPSARLVAGYRKWQTLGRQVRKGEKGLTILAPLLKRDPDHPTERVVYGFKSVKVFDISQTDGDPIPTPARPTLLEGDSDAVQAALQALQRFCHQHEIQVSRDLNAGSALGLYQPASRSIRLRPDLSPLQELKTFVHELAHALLHTSTSDRVLAELEAESCAFLVLHELGLDETGGTEQVNHPRALGPCSTP